MNQATSESVILSYPHIDKCDGQPARLTNHPRFRVAQLIMAQMAYGWSAEEIGRQYPFLTPAEVHSALAYYHDHQEEIDQEIAEEWRQSETLRTEATTSPMYLKLRAKGLL